MDIRGPLEEEVDLDHFLLFSVKITMEVWYFMSVIDALIVSYRQDPIIRLSWDFAASG